MNVAPLLGLAVLADLELALNALDGDAKADNPGQHGAAEFPWHGLPFFGKRRLVSLNEPAEQGVLAGLFLDQFHGSVSVHGDVVPGGHRERIDIESGRNVAVRAGEHDQRLVPGERPPVAIGLGEVAFEQPVRALVLDHQRQMRSHQRRGKLGAGLRAKKDGEGIGPHGLDENGPVGQLVESGCVQGGLLTECARSGRRPRAGRG